MKTLIQKYKEWRHKKNWTPEKQLACACTMLDTGVIAKPIVVDLPLRRQSQLLVKKINIPEDNHD